MNLRKLCVESLEERTLLVVMAGGIEQARGFVTANLDLDVPIPMVSPTSAQDPVDARISITLAIPTAPEIDTIDTLSV